MTRKLILTLFLILWPCLAWSWEGVVIYVADGDSFVVQRTDGEQVDIRIWGVDCPERNQRFGYAATKYAEENLLGVRIEITEMYQDIFDRTVGGTLLLANGQTWQDMLLSAGLAWVDPRFCPECNNWMAIEARARTRGVGLWADPNPVAPWDWRRGVR